MPPVRSKRVYQIFRMSDLQVKWTIKLITDQDIYGIHVNISRPKHVSKKQIDSNWSYNETRNILNIYNILFYKSLKSMSSRISPIQPISQWPIRMRVHSIVRNLMRDIFRIPATRIISPMIRAPNHYEKNSPFVWNYFPGISSRCGGSTLRNILNLIIIRPYFLPMNKKR